MTKRSYDNPMQMAIGPTDWVVCTRKVGDTDSPALIVGYHKRRYQAVQEADYWREAQDRADWCVWVERRSSI